MEQAESNLDSLRVFTTEKWFVQLGMAARGIACCSSATVSGWVSMQAIITAFQRSACSRLTGYPETMVPTISSPAPQGNTPAAPPPSIRTSSLSPCRGFATGTRFNRRIKTSTRGRNAGHAHPGRGRRSTLRACRQSRPQEHFGHRIVSL